MSFKNKNMFKIKIPIFFHKNAILDKSKLFLRPQAFYKKCISKQPENNFDKNGVKSFFIKNTHFMAVDIFIKKKICASKTC